LQLRFDIQYAQSQSESCLNPSPPHLQLPPDQPKAIMTSLYSTLPITSYSLRDFVRFAKTLEHTDNSAFNRLLLTGETEDHQVSIDPIRNVMQPNHPVTISRDYDSIIGVTDEIIVQSSISVYPIPNPAEVLSSSIHFRKAVTMENSQVRGILSKSEVPH
jgi:hypothetical protein